MAETIRERERKTESNGKEQRGTEIKKETQRMTKRET